MVGVRGRCGRSREQERWWCERTGGARWWSFGGEYGASSERAQLRARRQADEVKGRD